MGIIKTLEVTVVTWLRENMGPPGLPLPEGLRVEMHPSFANRLMQDPDAFDYRSWQQDPDSWKKRFIVPVKITIDIPKDSWRLVTVTEELHIGGTMEGLEA